jgi:hypothetical protein
MRNAGSKNWPKPVAVRPTPMRGNTVGRWTAVATIATAALIAQDHRAPAANPATVPASLRLRGDPAASFELGLQTAPPAPARTPTGVVWAGGRCGRCVSEKLQSNAAPLPTDAKVLGMPLDAANAWFERISGAPPVVFWLRRTTLICAFSGSTQPKPTDDEWARLRIFFPSLATTSTRLEPHAAAHLWAERLIALDAALAELLELSPVGQARATTDIYSSTPFDRAEIVLFSEEKAHESFESFLGGDPVRSRADGRIFKGRPVVGVRVDGDDRNATARRFMFASTSTILRSLSRDERPSGSWIRIGVAHLMEQLSAPKPTIGGDAASGTMPADEHDARFRSPEDRMLAVLQLVDEGKAPRLAALAHTDEGGLSPRSRLVAASVVRFMAGLDRRRFAAFWKRGVLQAGGPDPSKDLSAATQAAFGCDVPTFENAWKVWAGSLRTK